MLKEKVDKLWEHEATSENKTLNTMFIQSLEDMKAELKTIREQNNSLQEQTPSLHEAANAHQAKLQELESCREAYHTARISTIFEWADIMNDDLKQIN